MNRLVLTVFIFLLIQLTIDAQTTNKTDSLNDVLKKAATDTARISALGDLVKAYGKAGETSKAFTSVYTMLALSQNTSDVWYKAFANQLAGYVHSIGMNSDSIKFYSNKALSLLKNDTSNKALKVKVGSTINLAVAYSASGNMRKAVELTISNLPALEQLKDQRLFHLTNHNISASFVMLKEYDKAYKYMLKDVELADEKNADREYRVLSYLNANVVCFNLKEYDQQVQYLKKSKKSLEDLGPNRYWGQYYAYEAMHYAAVSNLAKARPALDSAFAEIEKHKDHRMNVYLAYEAKREVAFAAGDIQKAREAALVLYNMGKEDDYNEAVLSAAKYIADFSNALGDYKTAFQYLQIYSDVQDSTQRQELLQNIHELEVQYQTSEKEKKILSLQKEKLQAELTSKNNRLLNWLLGIGSGIFLLIILFLFYTYRNHKKQEAQRFREVKQQQELQLTQAILEGGEKERLRIARDLHDGLGGSLSGIRFKLLGQQKTEPTPLTGEVIGQMDHAINELRRIARNMMPETLIRSGLKVALEDLCISLSTPATKIEFQSNGIQDNLSIAAQINIYRIIQELLSNALRHSNAGNVLVQCIQNDDIFLITAEDDGRGFDTTANADGMGLSNIRNRVEYMKGSVEINSMLNQGTTINIELHL